MTEEELKQEAEEWLNKWKLCNKCENKVDCISNFSYCKEVVLQSYLASAEPREKRIEELIALINAERERQEKCDDVHLRTIADLEKENAELKTKKIPQLERKIASIRGSHRVDLAKLNARIEQVERLKKENAELKILVSSILYEINALWDISEMNEDVRKHAERIDSEVIK